MKSPEKLGRISPTLPGSVPRKDVPPDRFVFDIASKPVNRLVRSGVSVKLLQEIANADAEPTSDDI